MENREKLLVVEPKPVLLPKLLAALCRRSKRGFGSIKGQVIVLCKGDITKLWNEVAGIRIFPYSPSNYNFGTKGDMKVRHPCIGGPRGSIRVVMGKVKPDVITFMSTAEYGRKRKGRSI